MSATFLQRGWPEAHHKTKMLLLAIFRATPGKRFTMFTDFVDMKDWLI